MDANNDGLVDQLEFVAAGGTTKEFAKHGANGDGVLDAEEPGQLAKDKFLFRSRSPQSRSGSPNRSSRASRHSTPNRQSVNRSGNLSPLRDMNDTKPAGATTEDSVASPAVL